MIHKARTYAWSSILHTQVIQCVRLWIAAEFSASFIERHIYERNSG